MWHPVSCSASGPFPHSFFPFPGDRTASQRCDVTRPKVGVAGSCGDREMNQAIQLQNPSPLSYYSLNLRTQVWLWLSLSLNCLKKRWKETAFPKCDLATHSHCYLSCQAVGGQGPSPASLAHSRHSQTLLNISQSYRPLLPSSSLVPPRGMKPTAQGCLPCLHLAINEVLLHLIGS